MPIEPKSRGCHCRPGSVLSLAVIIFVGLAVSSFLSRTPGTGLVGVDDSKPLKAEDVQALQAQYRAERAAAEKGGWLKKFSPELTVQADQLAVNGERALDRGRLASAQQLLIEARRRLPAPPLNFPDHVFRVLGNPK